MMSFASVSPRCCGVQQRSHQDAASSRAYCVRGFSPCNSFQQRRVASSSGGSVSSIYSARLVRARAGANGATNGATVGETVADVMTPTALFCHPHTTLDEALEMLVSNKVSGLAVVDNDSKVVGVVSDFDLLPLEALAADSNGANRPAEMFPDVNTDWTAFNDLSIALMKNVGKCVEDVMTPEPIVVRPSTGLVDAAQLLLKRRVRRMPVVDAEGKLVGVLSRSNIIKAALAHRRAMNA